MNTIKTKFGEIYIETPNDREEKDRIKIFDSKKEFLDYFTTEAIEEGWDNYDSFYKDLSDKLAKQESVEDILDYLGIAFYTVSKNWEDLIQDFYEKDVEYVERDGKRWFIVDDDEIPEELDEEVITDNEWYNKIGDYHISVCEY